MSDLVVTFRERQPRLFAISPDLTEDEQRHRDVRMVAKVAIEENLRGQRSAESLREIRQTLSGKEYGVPKGDFDAIEKEAKAFHRARLQAEREQAATSQKVMANTEGYILPSPSDPLKVARVLVLRFGGPDKHRYWRGEWYAWTGTYWRKEEEKKYTTHVYAHTEDAVFDGGEKRGMVPWQPRPSSVDGVVHALASVVYRDGALDDDRCLALTNCVLDAETLQEQPHTPARFNLSALPHAYDPAASWQAWQEFLDQVLPADAQALLQEWFGYVLSGRTDMHKILMMVGPPRSGKSTIAEVLQALVGKDGHTNPTLPSLAGNFGRMSLIGKLVAVLSDINWQARDAAQATEYLKAISGEDAQEIDRKNRDPWVGTLGVRFMLISNDDPTFRDASSALANRMLHITFEQSFLGREDTGLRARLTSPEVLPGVLNWALAGLARLQQQGRFTVPASSAEQAAETLRNSSPVRGFLDDCCVEEPAGSTSIPALYRAYRQWCDTAGYAHPLSAEQFSKALRAVFRGRALVTFGERVMVDGVRGVPVTGLTCLTRAVTLPVPFPQFAPSLS